MSDMTTVNQGNAQRRAGDKPRPVGKSMNFNPLHPSMELPPEELIRLLGLETKKLRKQHKKPERKKPKKTAAEPKQDMTPERALDSLTQQTPASSNKKPAAAPAAIKRREKYRRESESKRRRRSLMFPAIAVGLLSGIGLSAYLFWGQPAPEAQPVAVKPVSTQPAKAKKPVAAKPVRPKAAVKPAPAYADDPAWQAAIRAESQRLRKDAEQRAAKRLNAASASVPAQPATGTTDWPAVTAPSPTVSDADQPSAAPVEHQDALPTTPFEETGAGYELEDEPVDTAATTPAINSDPEMAQQPVEPAQADDTAATPGASTDTPAPAESILLD